MFKEKWKIIITDTSELPCKQDRTNWIVEIQRNSEPHTTAAISVDDQGKIVNIQKWLSTYGILNWSVKFKWYSSIQNTLF